MVRFERLREVRVVLRVCDKEGNMRSDSWRGDWPPILLYVIHLKIYGGGEVLGGEDVGS